MIMSNIPLRGLLWTLGVTALLSGCGTGDQIETSNTRDRAETSSSSSPIETEPYCDEAFPFEPTFLPKGFTSEVFPGPFPGGRPGEDFSSSGTQNGESQVIVHYRGSGSRAIEMRRPGTLFSELAQGNDAPTIEMLGTQTSGFAPIAPGGDDCIVQFTYPAGAAPDDWCATYSLNEYGVSLEELKRVAEDLRPRG
jgi:hypothetical protein